ncbi:molybdopterin-dependent oxidoreductase (plasmid) [Aminobacter sp. UC22_36]|uniref:molybdopterin-dependent oxidoreductase n=1 Tax=Aminobacter sp. UC22_36 TaxID=3374549 RepID=UPI00375680D8
MNHLLSSTVRAVAMATSLILFALSAAQAEDGKLHTPKGPPILIIEGNIGVTNGNGVASFDRAMLEEIGVSSIETTTPWFTGLVKFEGVPLQKIMELVGADGKEVVAVALNDYKTTIPTEDFARHNVLLALKRDGQYMAVSDKGPLFIVYPYDSKPELQSQKFYSRSVWQLARLIVR